MGSEQMGEKKKHWKWTQNMLLFGHSAIENERTRIDHPIRKDDIYRKVILIYESNISPIFDSANENTFYKLLTSCSSSWSVCRTF